MDIKLDTNLEAQQQQRELKQQEELQRVEQKLPEATENVQNHLNQNDLLKGFNQEQQNKLTSALSFEVAKLGGNGDIAKIDFSKDSQHLVAFVGRDKIAHININQTLAKEPSAQQNIFDRQLPDDKRLNDINKCIYQHNVHDKLAQFSKNEQQALMQAIGFTIDDHAGDPPKVHYVDINNEQMQLLVGSRHQNIKLDTQSILAQYQSQHVKEPEVAIENEVRNDLSEVTPASIINKGGLEAELEASLNNEYTVTIQDMKISPLEENPTLTQNERDSLDTPLVSDREFSPEQIQQMTSFSDDRYEHHMNRIQSEINELNGQRNSQSFQNLSEEKQAALNERINVLSGQRREIFDIVDKPIEEQASYFGTKDALEPLALFQQQEFQRVMQSQGFIADNLKVDANDDSFGAHARRNVAATIATGKAVGSVIYDTAEGLVTLGVGTIKFAGAGWVGLADSASGGRLSANFETVRNINEYGYETSSNLRRTGSTLYDKGSELYEAAREVQADAIQGIIDPGSDAAARTSQRLDAAGDLISNRAGQYWDETKQAYNTGDYHTLADNLKTPIDIGSMAIPGAAFTKLGRGARVADGIADVGRAASHLDEVADVARAANRLDDVADASRTANRLDDGLELSRRTERLEGAADAGRRLDNVDDLAHSPILRNGEQFDGLGRLKPNVRYQTGEYEYIYRTDANGRLTHVQADDLHLTTRNERLPHDPDTPGKVRGQDHAGHIIGDRFGGSPELDNLVSQLSRVNLSDYKVIENRMADALAEGKRVTLDVKINYDADKLRPSSFEIDYSIDGVPRFRRIIND